MDYHGWALRLLLAVLIFHENVESGAIMFAMNLAVKRSGGWIPNFLKFKGKGVCTGLMKGENNLFKQMAKELKAPDPPRCPLPAGTAHLNYQGADPTTALKVFGLEVLPYGEFRISANVTHKEDTVLCVKAFVDLVPKKGKSG